MFLREMSRIQGGKKVTYILLVENKRVEGKVKQTLIHSFGNKAELIASGKYNDLCEQFAAPDKRTPTIPMDASISSVKHFGYDRVVSTLWKKLDLFKILDNTTKGTKIKYDFSEAVYCMVLNRLLAPGSKQKVMLWKDTIARDSFSKLDNQHLYRALDHLTINMDQIEEALFRTTCQITGDELDLVLFDTTATYFEGEGVHTDILQLGHSKDHRPDRKQIIVGVLMTGNGIPVSHAVFDGNTADAPAFREVIIEFEQRFKIRNVIIAADRGMVGDKTCETLSGLKYPYILGARFRNDHQAQQAITIEGTFEVVKENLHVKDVKVDGVRYIVCFNPEEAARDKAIRAEIIEQLETKLSRQSGVKELINNRGMRKWIRMEGSAVIDRDKVTAEEKYDGIYVLKTDTDLPAAEVALSYKKLWKIEQGFRDLKSELGLRPVYHWTEYRICGHVAVCFLALHCECLLDYLIRKSFPEMTWEEIIKAKHELAELHDITFEKNEQQWNKKSDLTPFAIHLIDSLK